MALIDEYVESATPVGSSRIAKQYLTGISSATIRNELMGLETDGYVRSPHTSAGRVPTNVGYRVFVNTLLLRERLAAGQETGISGNIDMREATSRGADIEQRAERILDFLSNASGLLSVLWCVKPDVRVHHRGMPRLLAQPEFQDASALIPLMQLIEDEGALARLLGTALMSSSFVVKIGIEDEAGCLSSYSMVAEIYGNEQFRGVLAVFGPTRMDYRKVISAVLLASRLLDYPQTRVPGW
jgi:transcriptional regulator of heat shock response